MARNSRFAWQSSTGHGNAVPLRILSLSDGSLGSQAPGTALPCPYGSVVERLAGETSCEPPAIRASWPQAAITSRPRE